MKLTQIKNWKNKLKYYFLLSFVFVLTSCYTIREKKMLKVACEHGVPKSSIWVGGKDGGEWVNFTFNEDSTFAIDTYNDYTYKRNNRYKFKIICSGVTVEEIKNSFDFTNGLFVVWKKNNRINQCVEQLSNT